MLDMIPRYIVRHLPTGRFFRSFGHWTPDEALAFGFEQVDRALSVIRELALDAVEIMEVGTRSELFAARGSILAAADIEPPKPSLEAVTAAGSPARCKTTLAVIMGRSPSAIFR